MFVVAVGHVALAHEGLEVRAELHRVGRIHVDGLHLAAEPLVSDEGVHHHQGIAEDQPVHPPVAVLVCLEQPIVDGEVAFPEEIEHVHLAVAGMPFEGFQDRGGGQPLVHEQGQGGYVEGEALGLSGPVEEGPGERLQRGGVFACRGKLLFGPGEIALGYSTGCAGVGVGSDIGVSAWSDTGAGTGSDTGTGSGVDDGGQSREALLHRGDLCFGPLARRVLSVPIERRRQR